MKLTTLCLIVSSCLVLCSAATPPKKSAHLYVSHFENVLGTSMEMKTYAVNQKDAAIAEAAATSEIARIAGILSAYDPNSEFSRWLQTNGQAVRVSPELFEVLGLFDRWRTGTNGALDASAEVITQLWKQSAAKGRIPTPGELETAVAEVRQPHWRLDSVKHTATHLDHAPLMLNSFAKSYIIQHASAAAMSSGRIDAMVLNIGGDLVVSGNLMETINISDPKADAENEVPIDRLSVGKSAVATSGNYRRGELISGHWYSHIVDPRTGLPADEVISATVVSPDATVAGALATTFNVLTPEESIELATRFPGAEYLILTRNGRRFESGGWKTLEVPGTKQDVESHWNNNFELIVNLEINLQKEGFAKRPYVAVWIEDANHAPVRTIGLWHERDKYLPELKSWYLKYRGQYASDASFLGSVSSATRSAGKYSLKWDGKDDKGNEVKPGVYTVKIEAAREHGTYQLIRQEMDFNQTPQKLNLPGNVEIASASLDYRKKPDGN
jgi:thiamine biosynthesis lipoprotein ApbE